ncbi:MAG: hypothetical protein J7642_11825 [Cyanobacteria bacterium SBC]|nr:hypothetical protein [Cyanobacteria bacterium SBC]
MPTVQNIEKTIKKAVKQVLSQKGIDSSTRKGNKELNFVVQKIAKGIDRNIQAAEEMGKLLGEKIVEISQKFDKKHLDRGILQQLVLDKSFATTFKLVRDEAIPSQKTVSKLRSPITDFSPSEPALESEAVAEESSEEPTLETEPEAATEESGEEPSSEVESEAATEESGEESSSEVEPEAAAEESGEEPTPETEPEATAEESHEEPTPETEAEAVAEESHEEPTPETEAEAVAEESGEEPLSEAEPVLIAAEAPEFEHQA